MKYINSGNIKYLVLLIIVLLSLTGIFNHDLWSPDEPRVAEIGKEFLENDASLAVPKLNQEPFLEKPPLYFWCIALSYKVFGINDYAARIPSVFFGFGTLLFVYLLARKMYGQEIALRSCAILSLSQIFFYITHVVLVDSALIFFVSCSIYWLYLALNAKEPKKGNYYQIFYLFTLGAFFSKGFIGIAFPFILFMCWIIWTKNLKELKKAKLHIGFLILCAGIGLWFLALYKSGTFTNLKTFLLYNNLQRFMPGNEYLGGHSKPIYYYFLAYWSTFAPWSVLSPAIFFFLYRTKGNEKNMLFLAIWFISGFILLSLSKTKREIYLAPLVPSLAILAGLWFYKIENLVFNGLIDRICQCILVCVLGFFPAALSIYAYKLNLYTPINIIIFAIVILANLILIFYSFIKNHRLKLYSLFMFVGLYYFCAIIIFVPYINEKKSFKPFCSKLEQLMSSKDKFLYAYKPDETTKGIVPFYTGYYLIPVDDLAAAQSLKNDSNILMIVVDKRSAQPRYNSLKDLFPNVLVSEMSGNRRHMRILSNE